MQANDILTVDYVIRTSGVQTVFTQDWEVLSYAGPDSDPTVILDLVTLFWDAIKDVMATSAVLDCVKMINKTTPAKAIVFPNLAGQVADEPHPPHQVLRVDLYGQNSGVEEMWRNSNNFSGIAQQFSESGRFTDETLLDDVLTHFSAPQDTGANGAILQAKVRQMTDPGAPSDPGPYVAPTFAYHDCAYARLSETFRTLRSRKFELCV